MSALASTDEALAAFAAEVGDHDPVAVQGGGTRWHLGGVLADSVQPGENRVALWRLDGAGQVAASGTQQVVTGVDGLPTLHATEGGGVHVTATFRQQPREGVFYYPFVRVDFDSSAAVTTTDMVTDELLVIGSTLMPDGDTVVIGHSLGGLMSVGYAASGRPLPDAVVVSGPALGAELDPAARRLARVGPLIRRFAPGFEHRDEWDVTVYAEDVRVGERFQDDPLRTDFITISLALETLGAIEQARSGVADISIPMLCVHGGRDKLVPVHASEILETVDGAERIVYDDLGHEVFNEPVGLDVVDTCIGWIERTLGL